MLLQIPTVPSVIKRRFCAYTFPYLSFTGETEVKISREFWFQITSVFACDLSNKFIYKNYMRKSVFITVES